MYLKLLRNILNFGIVMALGLAVIGLASCTKEEPAKSETQPVPHSSTATTADPAGPCPAGGNDKTHLGSMATSSPHPAGERSHAVVVPEVVEQTWKSVTIEITDKESNSQQQAVIEIGGSYTIPESTIRITVPHFLPDFAMNSFGMTSKSNEPENPAIKFEVFDGEERLFSGWLFSKFPDVHTFNHDRYSFNLTDWQKR